MKRTGRPTWNMSVTTVNNLDHVLEVPVPFRMYSMNDQNLFPQVRQIFYNSQFFQIFHASFGTFSDPFGSWIPSKECSRRETKVRFTLMHRQYHYDRCKTIRILKLRKINVPNLINELMQIFMSTFFTFSLLFWTGRRLAAIVFHTCFFSFTVKYNW